MTDVWLGHRTYREAMEVKELSILGNATLMCTIPRWLVCTTFQSASMAMADAKPANSIGERGRCDAQYHMRFLGDDLISDIRVPSTIGMRTIRID
jgi:hypothetical protein